MSKLFFPRFVQCLYHLTYFELQISSIQNIRVHIFLPYIGNSIAPNLFCKEAISYLVYRLITLDLYHKVILSFPIIVWFAFFTFTKGQLISKCLFGAFNSPKNEQKQFDLRYHSSKVEFFVRFLGELKITKRHFEINWPLVRSIFVHFLEELRIL